MIGLSTKKLLIAGVVAGGFLATPSESHAIFHWFSRCCAPRTTYLPPAPAVNCCPPQQTYRPQVCNYVPVTAYRTQVYRVPVTAYRPQTSSDPCTGCPTTTYRPVTTYVQQVRRVPYTTYRLSFSNPYSTRAYGSTVAYQAPATVAPSSCNSCAPSTTYSTPPYTAPAPAATYPGPTAPQQAPRTFGNGPASQPPTLAPSAGSSSRSYPPPVSTQQPPPAATQQPPPAPTQQAPRTFDNEPPARQPSLSPPANDNPPNTGAALQRPIQDLNTSNSLAPRYPNPAPRLIDPDARTTSLPVRTVTASYTTVHAPSAAMAPVVPMRLPAAYQKVSPEGWRSSRR